MKRDRWIGFIAIFLFQLTVASPTQAQRQRLEVDNRSLLARIRPLNAEANYKVPPYSGYSIAETDLSGEWNVATAYTAAYAGPLWAGFQDVLRPAGKLNFNLSGLLVAQRNGKDSSMKALWSWEDRPAGVRVTWPSGLVEHYALVAMTRDWILAVVFREKSSWESEESLQVISILYRP